MEGIGAISSIHHLYGVPFPLRALEGAETIDIFLNISEAINNTFKVDAVVLKREKSLFPSFLSVGTDRKMKSPCGQD